MNTIQFLNTLTMSDCKERYKMLIFYIPKYNAISSLSFIASKL